MRKKIASKKPLTYISLFSGAGVGCYGFKLENFECVATNEIIKRRLNVQKHNNKCRYDSAYISGNIIEEETKDQIRNEFSRWKNNHGVKELDVLIATPPCQGMSVANHKKGDELARNSLVVESIKLAHEFNPKFFLFENVRAFLKSICTDIDGKDKKIREAIELNLGGKYNIHYQVINFKNHGNPSSRTRTVVLGVRKDQQEVTPLDFMPAVQREKTLREIIGHFPPLQNMGSIDSSDIYHNFKPYAKHMMPWLEKITEGQSAFDNKDPKRRPHKIIDGKIVFNVKKNGDKYTRCFWDKPSVCIHTRSDILASQATVHPTDNRVFSIRELMKMMSIPDSFKWSDLSEQVLNELSYDEKRRFLKKEEMNIRQSIGEAVSTTIFQQIATKMRKGLTGKILDEKGVQKIIVQENLEDTENLKGFLKKNLKNYSFSELSKIAELSNAQKLQHAAYYTRQDICFTVIKDLPDASNYSSIKILEPSVGTGNFLPLLIEKYKTVPSVEIDVIDIDKNAVDILKILVKKIDMPKNIKINFLNEDFLLFGRDNLFENEERHYDIVVGNPPFGKITNDNALLAKYKKGKRNTKTSNLFSFFLEKAIHHADMAALIIPKSFLSAPEFDCTREFVADFAIEKITDYGERGFKGVKIETISLILSTKETGENNKILVESYVKNEIGFKNQDYICTKDFPYWLVYRDSFFDKVADKLRFNIFTAYRDRQITKRITKSKGKIRVLKSRNIGSNSIVDIPDYDSYIDEYENLSVAKYMNHNDAILVPNLTYRPRACFLPQDTIVDGSVAVLTPKTKVKVTEDDLGYYSTEEFIEFYRVARNHGTRSLNIDNNSVFFFGVIRP